MTYLRVKQRRIVLYFEPQTEIIEVYSQLKKVADNHKRVNLQTIRNHFLKCNRKNWPETYIGQGYEVRRLYLK